ncbi:hypothetical protein GCM10028797_09750 [Dyella agri]
MEAAGAAEFDACGGVALLQAPRAMATDAASRQLARRWGFAFMHGIPEECRRMLADRGMAGPAWEA